MKWLWGSTSALHKWTALTSATNELKRDTSASLCEPNGWVGTWKKTFSFSKQVALQRCLCLQLYSLFSLCLQGYKLFSTSYSLAFYRALRYLWRATNVKLAALAFVCRRGRYALSALVFPGMCMEWNEAPRIWPSQNMTRRASESLFNHDYSCFNSEEMTPMKLVHHASYMRQMFSTYGSAFQDLQCSGENRPHACGMFT